MPIPVPPIRFSITRKKKKKYGYSWLGIWVMFRGYESYDDWKIELNY